MAKPIVPIVHNLPVISHPAVNELFVRQYSIASRCATFGAKHMFCIATGHLAPTHGGFFKQHDRVDKFKKTSK